MPIDSGLPVDKYPIARRAFEATLTVDGFANGWHVPLHFKRNRNVERKS
jgi:hypothetical protein